MKKAFTLTNHFQERYLERINKLDSGQIRTALKDSEEMAIISEAVSSMDFEFIVEAGYHDHDKAMFYGITLQSEYYIFVANSSDQALLTLFPVDFGLTDNINSYACRSIVADIREFRKTENELRLEYESRDTQLMRSTITINEATIESLRFQISLLEDENKTLNNKIQLRLNNIFMVQENIKKLAYKMIYSINYSFEKLKK